MTLLHYSKLPNPRTCMPTMPFTSARKRASWFQTGLSLSNWACRTTAPAMCLTVDGFDCGMTCSNGLRIGLQSYCQSKLPRLSRSPTFSSCIGRPFHQTSSIIRHAFCFSTQCPRALSCGLPRSCRHYGMRDGFVGYPLQTLTKGV